MQQSNVAKAVSAVLAGRTNNHAYGERAFWVKGDEAQMAKKHELTVIIRPDDRSDSVKAPKQFLPLNEAIPVYCIAVPGDQAKGVSAKFEPDSGLTVVITGRSVKRLSDIRDSDLEFQGGVSVAGAQAFLVKPYLEKVLAPGKKFLPDSLITIYWVEYLPNETPASN